MERKEAIRSAYRLTGGNNFYDGMITCSTLSGKAVCRLVWDMNKAENDAYLEKALSGIPEHFSGKLLEVPVGTGILTMPLYRTLPKADITCLDYSADMMGQAQEKADRLHLKNVTFRQGDVGALPFADGAFDIVLSLNGFHAFPDKEAAYREVFRVLKPGGTFCGCFYVKGEQKRTDWFVRHVYEKTAGGNVRNRNTWNSEEHGVVCLPERTTMKFKTFGEWVAFAGLQKERRS